MGTSRIKRFKGKYYDIGTSNKSFIKVATDLHKLGIKNYMFMLEVKNPQVVDIDPWDPNITRDQISLIMLECMQNMWYYLREIAMIPEQGGSAMHYSAHRANIAQAWCILNGFDSDLCIPRQCGKTQSAVAIFVWAYIFGTTNSQTIFLNKDESASKANLTRMKDQIDLLPRYLKCDVMIGDDGKLNKEVRNATKLKHPISHNEVIIKGKATNQEGALNIARGLTAPLLYFDEIEFTNKIDIIIRNSAPVYVTAAANARKNNAIYGRVFTSTPGDLDTPCGMAANQLISTMPRWTEKIYDMTHDEIVDYIKVNGENDCDIFYIEYSYKQIGKTEEWFSTISSKIGDTLTVKREVLLQRLRGSDDSPFDRDDLEYLNNNIKLPKSEFILLDHFRFDLYEDIDKKIPYIAGVDCSTGSGSDNNAITLINPYTLCVAAEFKSSYIGETDFCKVLVQMVVDLAPRAIVCIERNSVGDGIIDLLMTSRIATRIYYDKGRDLLLNSIDRNSSTESVLKKRAESKKYMGVYTEGSSRETMMAILMRHVHEFKDKIYTKNLVNDICDLVKRPSGKIEAVSGKHDDCVMSYLIALYVYYHGNNLPMFGFEKGSQEIDNQNQGLKTIDDVSDAEDILPLDVVNALKAQKAAENDSYDDLFRQALRQSQSYDKTVGNSKAVSIENIKNPTDDFMDDEEVIPMDFFRDLNGLTN